MNQGDNLFTDRDLVLKDMSDEARTVPVAIPMALEMYSALPDGGVSSAPQTVTDVLGKRVVIRGRFEEGVLKGRGTTDLLKVEEVRIIP